jgi:hypothetical protein
MKYFIASLVFSSMVACNTSDEIGLRDWYLYEPKISPGFSLPAGDINWFVDDDVPDGLVQGLTTAADEWRLAMGCNFTPRQLPTSENMHVHFSCNKDVYEPAAKLSLDEQHIVHVEINNAYCKSGAEAVGQYAWSNALGFEEYYNNLTPVISGFHASAEAVFGSKTGRIDTTELDGLRIWAKSQGAAECSKDEPNWSWVDMPKGWYHSHPTEADVEAWLAMTPEERQKSDILNRVQE